MAFKKVKERIVKRDVDIEVPADGAKSEKAVLKITFNLLRQQTGEAPYTKEFFTKRIQNVEDYLDEDGKQITFSPEVLDDLLSEEFVLASVSKHWINMMIQGSRGN